jgi:diguanylate cyclase (GGDEF)-like protein
MPPIDVQTLLVIAVSMHAAATVLVAAVWRGAPEEEAAANWAVSGLATTVGLLVVLLRPADAPWWSIVAYNVAGQLGLGFFVRGVLLFERRRAPLWGALAGAAVIFAALEIPAIGDEVSVRIGLVSVSVIVHASIVGGVLLAGRRREPLPSRVPLAVVAIVAALTQVVRIALLVVFPIELHELGNATWVGPIGTVLLVESVAILVLAAMMLRERAEARHRRASRLDPLTGILNRRAFVAEAMDRLRLTGPAALLLFDLDRFKRINDTWGHAAGDRVICAFSDLVGGRSRSNDVFGRWGGEEFALLLAGADLVTAQRFADEVRRAFAATELGSADRSIRATVSVGVSATDLAGHELDALLAAADAGLYAAKRAGRNRVVVRPASDDAAPVVGAISAVVVPCHRFGL